MKPYYERNGITIFHGDCFDVLPCLSGLGAVVTDPPYSSGGQFRGDRMRGTVEKYVQTGVLAYRPEFSGDNRDQRSYLAWCSLWMNAARIASVAGAPIVAFSDWRQLPTTTDAIQAGGWTWRGIATWAKGYGRVNSTGFSASCEYAPWGTNGPAQEREKYPAGYFEFGAERGDDKVHVAQKPVEVMSWLLGIVAPGSFVCDPFMGSGTTLVAAKLAGLRAVGIEAEERYCEVAAKRLAQGVLDFGQAVAT